MNQSIFYFFLYTFLLSTSTTFAQDAAYQQRYQDSYDRTSWHREARFGMFIHWGAYAVPARGEWVQSNERITKEEYRKYVDAFHPTHYNPKEWARLAREAGMKYAVITAKHHDGFCMFDSDYTDYKITTNMPGRDLMQEYVNAFRAEGLKVGFYYSLIDWHHPDYPNVGNHPMRENEAWKKKTYNWDNYLSYMHNQVEELLTNYGKIDVLWLDYSFDDYSGEKWNAAELVEKVRKLQPGIILNNRLVVNQHLTQKERTFSGYGDFETPEQGIPQTPILDEFGQPIPWETCLTLNNNWGYHADDHHWKSAESVIHALVNCVSKDGNLLLNVGPDQLGLIPQSSQAILKEVGQWMDKHGESIYGCGPAQVSKPEWGFFTQKEKTCTPIGHIQL